MGVSDLVVVAPEADPNDREARRLSTHGEELLERARVVANLGDAVRDCLLVIATSARTGKLIRGGAASPQEILPRLVDALSTGPAALVFGPETNGLTDEELTRCHYVVHISTSSEYPALNLAQAVAICLYEIRRLWLKATAPAQRDCTPATFASQERMFGHLRTALEGIHFLYGPKADALMHALRHLIGRAQPTEMEIEILHGLARQIRWLAKNHPDGRQRDRSPSDCDSDQS
jgi:tRNA/rRNA methyltransferase